MKKNKFDRAERTLFESFEKDRWHSVPSLEDELSAYRMFAKAQIERDNRLISISRRRTGKASRKRRIGREYLRRTLSRTSSTNL